MVQSTIKNSITKKEKYPYLGIRNGTIVLFTNVKTGVILKGDDTDPIGTGYNDWAEHSFKVFKDKLVMTNNY